jgi:hypothetical protein
VGGTPPKIPPLNLGGDFNSTSVVTWTDEGITSDIQGHMRAAAKAAHPRDWQKVYDVVQPEINRLRDTAGEGQNAWATEAGKPKTQASLMLINELVRSGDTASLNILVQLLTGEIAPEDVLGKNVDTTNATIFD